MHSKFRNGLGRSGRGLGEVWERSGRGLGEVWGGSGTGTGNVWDGFGRGLGSLDSRVPWEIAR